MSSAETRLVVPAPSTDSGHSKAQFQAVHQELVRFLTRRTGNVDGARDRLSQWRRVEPEPSIAPWRNGEPCR